MRLSLLVESFMAIDSTHLDKLLIRVRLVPLSLSVDWLPRTGLCHSTTTRVDPARHPALCLSEPIYQRDSLDLELANCHESLVRIANVEETSIKCSLGFSVVHGGIYFN